MRLSVLHGDPGYHRRANMEDAMGLGDVEVIDSVMASNKHEAEQIKRLAGEILSL